MELKRLKTFLLLISLFQACVQPKASRKLSEQLGKLRTTTEGLLIFFHSDSISNFDFYMFFLKSFVSIFSFALNFNDEPQKLSNLRFLSYLENTQVATDSNEMTAGGVSQGVVMAGLTPVPQGTPSGSWTLTLIVAGTGLAAFAILILLLCCYRLARTRG